MAIVRHQKTKKKTLATKTIDHSIVPKNQPSLWSGASPHIGRQIGLHWAHYTVCQPIPNLNVIHFNRTTHTFM